MKKLISALVLSACVAGLSTLSTSVLAEKSAAPAANKAKSTVPELTVEQAAARLQVGAQAIDANNVKTRTTFGVIPKAILLSSSSQYKVAELPKSKDTDLIFYCGNTNCTASDAAAARAIEQGYTKVSVLRPGIQGWKEAGQPVQPYKEAPVAKAAATPAS